MSRFQEIQKDNIGRRQRILEGKFNCLPFPFVRFRKKYPGVEQGKFIILTANQKIGKSKLADYLFIYEPLFFMMEHPELKVKVLYFSLEMSAKEKYNEFLCHLLYRLDKIHIDTRTLRSIDSPCDEKILQLLETERYQKYIKAFENMVIFNDTDKNPTGINIKCKDYALAHGHMNYITYQAPNELTGKMEDRQGVDPIKPYTQDDEDEYRIIILDNAANLATEKGCNNKMETIDRMAKYGISLKKQLNYVFVLIQHQALCCTVHNYFVSLQKFYININICNMELKILEIYNKFPTMSYKDIAKQINCSKSTVLYYFRKNNIIRDRKLQLKLNNTDRNKNIIITEKAKEILVGTILGDATISKYNRNCDSIRILNSKVSFTHSLKLKEYALYLCTLLTQEGLKCNCIENTKLHCSKIHGRLIITIGYFQVSVVRNILFNQWRDAWYPNGIKIIPREMVSTYLSPLALAIWYMDDGSKNNYSYYLHTEGFTVDDVNFLRLLLLEKYNINTSLHYMRGKPVIYIRGNSKSTFISLISPYICLSMQYKL